MNHLTLHNIHTHIFDLQQSHNRASAAAARRRRDDAWLQDWENLHPHLTPDVWQEVRAQLQTKQRYGSELGEELERVKAVWPRLRGLLQASAISSERITEALRQAGCADRASAIGVSHEHLTRTLIVCRHIRNRYVALDLVDDLGLLEDWASEIAAHSEQI